MIFFDLLGRRVVDAFAGQIASMANSEYGNKAVWQYGQLAQITVTTDNHFKNHDEKANGSDDREIKHLNFRQIHLSGVGQLITLKHIGQTGVGYFGVGVEGSLTVCHDIRRRFIDQLCRLLSHTWIRLKVLLST